METVVNISKAVSAWSKSKGLSDGQWVLSVIWRHVRAGQLYSPDMVGQLARNGQSATGFFVMVKELVSSQV